MLDNPTFEQSYTLNQSYYQTLRFDEQFEFIKRHFNVFLNENDIINFELLKQKLIENISCKDNPKPSILRLAVDLFKTHYALTYKCLNLNCIEKGIFNDIKTIYGHNLIAHGVEEAKGGINNILLMWVTNEILVPRQHWGQLVDGLPNISPARHGPYYLIASIDGGQAPHYPKPENILYVLIPYDEVKTMLEDKVDTLVKDSMLTVESARDLRSKLLTYNEFYRILLEKNCNPCLLLNKKTYNREHEYLEVEKIDTSANEAASNSVLDFDVCQLESANRLGL